ncbi:MAG: hypothetical protein ACYTF1_24915 [Planctomycetota bacterium]|jgi:hypothetical protein
MTVAPTSVKKDNLSGFRKSNPYSNQITATEVIDGVKCRITLQQDASGHYREIKLTPLEQTRVITKNI